QTYIDFLAQVRQLYPHQPFFLFSPWGWPNPDSPNSFYYPGAYEAVLATRSHGDHNMFLVNTTGWVTYAYVVPDNLHPSVSDHAKIAGLFQKRLEDLDYIF
ncbi:hypothetical protein C8R43DRAFT_872627, partial [Mycena crocata]